MELQRAHPPIDSIPSHTGVLRRGGTGRAALVPLCSSSLDLLRMSQDLVKSGREPALSDPRPQARWNRYYGAELSTDEEKRRAKSFDELSAPAVIRWSDGLSLNILPGDQLSRAVYLSDTYEPNTLVALKALLRPGDTFLDAGANAGIISLVASRWVGPEGRVYSFEPSEREYGRLVDNLNQNGATNVTPVQCAVSSASGHASLRIAPQTFGGLNTLGDRFPYDGIDTDRMQPVTLTSVDEFIEHHQIERVSVIKLDVEGAEDAALRGGSRMLSSHRPAIVAEVFSPSLQANGSSPAAVEALLRDADYLLFRIDDSTASLEPIDHLTDIDGQNFVALPREHATSMSRLSSEATVTTSLTGGFIERLLSSGGWGNSDFCLIDVGASGGIDPRWSIFGDRLTAVGFDPLVAEVDRLNHVETRPKVRYEAASVTCREYDSLFPLAVRNNEIASRFIHPFERSSAVAAHRIMNLDYVREMFNTGAQVEYSDRTVTLDEYLASTSLVPDFLKIDTDGGDFQVLLGAIDLVAQGHLLGIQIEAQFHGAVHDYANTFSNIDRFLKERGFTLFDLEHYRYSRAALPAEFAIGVPAQTTTGQVNWGEAVYFRDLAHPHYEQMFGVAPTRERLLKLCCLFVLYGLNDCAAEILSTGEALKTLPHRTSLLDALTPPLFGDTRYDDYLGRFNRDPSKWLPQNLKSPKEPERAASVQAADAGKSTESMGAGAEAVREENQRLRSKVAVLEARVNELKERASGLRRRLDERDERLKKLKSRQVPKEKT
jgi:FkbM family methyltransferase